MRTHIRSTSTQLISDQVLTPCLSVRPGPVYLITEFCRHGDLVNYLQRNKRTFLQSDTHAKRSVHTHRHESLSLSVCIECECLSPCSDSDGGYMDMNKEESAQYVAMQELRYADIEPAVYETPYTPPGDGDMTICFTCHLSVNTCSSLCTGSSPCTCTLNNVNTIWKLISARKN